MAENSSSTAARDVEMDLHGNNVENTKNRKTEPSYLPGAQQTSVQLQHPSTTLSLSDTTNGREIKAPHQYSIEMPQQPSPTKKTRRTKEQTDDYKKKCVPLYKAAMKGDWQAAEKLINNDLKVTNMSITKKQDTLLHIISTTKHSQFAQNLVNMMKVEDLKLQNGLGETALCLAVASDVKMVQVLLEKNRGLIKIRKNGDLPFMLAVRYGDKHMVEYIYSKTNINDEEWNYLDRKHILEYCLSLGLFDIALDIFKQCEDDEERVKIETDILGYLANSPSAFDGTMLPVIRRLLHSRNFSTELRGSIDDLKLPKIVRLILKNIVKQKYEDVCKLVCPKVPPLNCSTEPSLEIVSGQSPNEKDEGFLFTAARLGNYKFIRELLKSHPDITWERDGNKHTIFHIAVIHRQENVYNLLYDLGSKKFAMKDNDGNHILHLAAIMPAQSRLNIVSGAALQMQRELLWFKEVETRVSPADRRQVNNDGKTPQQLFTEQHADLMKEGEKWMKETASQCMIVAALIATIMFAAAFTLPGGTNDSGKPIFMKRSAFIVFAVTDAISLCTSAASILVFLAILTGRYTENDFLVYIPMKLMVGLVTLFISITTMMIVYGASFFLLYPESLKWIPVLVTVLAGLPVILFAGLQFRLLSDVINSTFNSRHLFRPKRHMLY